MALGSFSRHRHPHNSKVKDALKFVLLIKCFRISFDEVLLHLFLVLHIFLTCAAVCSSWREIAQKLVETPERSGKLTFPISTDIRPKRPGMSLLIRWHCGADSVASQWELYKASIMQRFASTGTITFSTVRMLFLITP
jgi:hypothetical protein